MRTVHLSRTPIAGAPLFAAKLLDEAGHPSCVFAPTKYPDGREFNLWQDWDGVKAFDAPHEAELAGADVLVVYNNTSRAGWVEAWMRRKNSVLIYCSQPESIRWREAERGGVPAATWASYHATVFRPARNDCPISVLPQLIPIRHSLYSPLPWLEKREMNVGLPRIGYSPSNTSEQNYGDTYWDGKGYETTAGVLARLSNEGICKAMVVTGLPHADGMSLKRRADYWIDEVVTGAYHKNTLEALSVGACPVLNLKTAVEVVVERVYGAVFPHFAATLERLESALRALPREPDALRWYARMCRDWTELFNDPADLIRRYYLPFFEKGTRL